MSTSSLGPMRIIWGAMVGGVVTYTAVIYVLMSSGTLSLGALDTGIMNVVGGVVSAYLAGVLVARRAMVSKVAADPDEAARANRYRAACIVSLALMEAGGLIVITMGLLSGAATWVLAGGGAAAVLMFMAKPSAQEAGL